MKKLTASLVFFALISAGVGIAAETGVVILKDGSVIKGDILSLDNNNLTLRSGTLGTIKIEASRIDSIRFDGGAGIPATSATSPSKSEIDGQIQVLQQRMLNDPEIMEMIMSLVSNPNFQQALKNPELMQAINTWDIEKLMINPEFKKLLNDPITRSIQQKIEH